MTSDFEDFIDFIEYVKRCREPGPRRYLRDYSDPFDKYTTQQFFLRYRFTQHAIKNTLMPLLEPQLKRPTKKGLPFAPEIMVLITLRYYATGRFQKLVGDFMNVCQQSVSRIIAVVSNAIALQMKLFVKFPATVEESSKAQQKFYKVAQFPGVIGCIGCTHIKIRSPGGASAEMYKYKKRFYSIKVQAVAGPNLEFFDMVARWPGSVSNSFIYNQSSVKQSLTTGNLQGQGMLIGDSGYTLSNELLTPISSPSTIQQELYNKSHTRTRKIIDKSFELWKLRFPCLQVGMGIKKETVVAVICACAALHNISIMLNDGMMLTSDDLDDIVVDDEDIEPVQEDPNSNGFLVRQSLVDRFFNNEI